MNVAIFTDSYKPYVNGVSVSVSTFAGYLRALGDTVHICAPGNPGYVDEDPHVLRFPSVRFRSRWLQYEPDYSMALGRFPGLPLLLERVFGATTFVPTRRPELRRALSAAPMDVVHTQSPFAMGAEGARWARRRKVPLVTTFHTMYTEYTHYTPFIPEWISRPTILRWVRGHCALADIVIAPTTAIVAVLREWGVKSPIEVLATGIDVTQFQGGDRKGTRERLGILPDALTLLYAGRLAPEKNIPMLLQTLARIAAIRKDVVLVFAGGGPSLSEITGLAAKMGLSSRVRFPGYSPREAMRDYYAAADVFTFPSLTETQGLVICEAMAAGLPTVAADSPAARSVLTDGGEGYVVPGEPEAMAAAVLRLADRGDELRRLSETGRVSALRFGVEESGRKLRAIYSAAIEARSSGKRGGVC